MKGVKDFFLEDGVKMLWKFHDDNRREYKYGLVIVCVLILMTNCNIIAIIKSIEKLLCMRISIDGEE